MRIAWASAGHATRVTIAGPRATIATMTATAITSVTTASASPEFKGPNIRPRQMSAPASNHAWLNSTRLKASAAMCTCTAQSCAASLPASSEMYFRHTNGMPSPRAIRAST